MNMTATAEIPTAIILHLAVTSMTAPTNIKRYVMKVSDVLYGSVMKTEA